MTVTIRPAIAMQVFLRSDHFPFRSCGQGIMPVSDRPAQVRTERRITEGAISDHHALPCGRRWSLIVQVGNGGGRATETSSRAQQHRVDRADPRRRPKGIHASQL